MFQKKSTILIIDDFFDQFDWYEEAFKKIPMFEQFNHPQRESFAEGTKWPGKRSEELFLTNPFVAGIFYKTFVEHLFFLKENTNLVYFLYTHLRGDNTDKEDYIHTDSSDLSCLVYLSKTNLDSGTCFYDEKNNVIADVAFVQNRAVIFHAGIPHKSKLNYGSSTENGRLTLNAFISNKE